jgi:hypothetical protein
VYEWAASDRRRRGDLTYQAAAATGHAGDDPADADAAPRDHDAAARREETPLVRWLTGAAWILECLRTLRIGTARPRGPARAG